MNERIRELASQCMVEVKNVPCTGSDGWTSLETVRQIDPEKFAALIVKECASIVSKRKNQAIDDNWNVDEAMSMAEMDLEEHFGVE